MNLSQRYRCQTQCPETEPAHANLPSRKMACEIQRILEVFVSDRNQCGHTSSKRLGPMEVRLGVQANVEPRKHRSRQPASSSAAIFPNILQYVRHLQTLTERNS